MDLIPLRFQFATGAKIKRMIQLLHMPALSMRVGFLLLYEMDKRLRQEIRHRGLTLYGNQFDLE
jgi:hypothetical protein